MKIIKTVVVKYILTEKKKEEIMTQLSAEKIQLQKEIEQLKFQMKKNLRNYTQEERTNRMVSTSFQSEMKKREEKLAMLNFKIEQLNKLQLGTEIKDGTIQAIEEINVGDDWEKITEPAEIIIKDGKIHEIRKGRINHDEMV